MGEHEDGGVGSLNSSDCHSAIHMVLANINLLKMLTIASLLQLLLCFSFPRNFFILICVMDTNFGLTFFVSFTRFGGRQIHASEDDGLINHTLIRDLDADISRLEQFGEELEHE